MTNIKYAQIRTWTKSSKLANQIVIEKVSQKKKKKSNRKIPKKKKKKRENREKPINLKYLQSSYSLGVAEDCVLSSPVFKVQASLPFDLNPFNGDITDAKGDEGKDESKAFDTKQLNLSLPMIAHLGFQAHPMRIPKTKATHIGTRNTKTSIKAIKHLEQREEEVNKTQIIMENN